MSEDQKFAAALEMVGADRYLDLACVNMTLALRYLHEFKALVDALLTGEPLDKRKLVEAQERLQREAEGHQGRLAFLEELRASAMTSADRGVQ